MLDQELRATLATEPHRVMIIVGAGVPLGALKGTPHERRASWGGLIRDGIAHAQGLGTLDAAEAKSLASLLDSPKTGFWIAAANQLTEALGGRGHGDFRRWLHGSVGKFAPAVQDRSVLDVLAQLERLKVTLATVNYDSLLEEATGAPAVTWREPAKVESVLNGHARGILHLHGHWEDPESIVLGTSSYDEVVRDPHARAVLTSIRMLRTLVFVGHGAGLGDPNWGSFLEWTAKVFAAGEYRHYRIAREAELAQLRTPELQAQRIALVGYPGGYDGLGPFLRSLVPERAPATTDGSPTASSPATTSAATEPEPRRVLLLVNIGERHYSFVSREDVEAHGGVPTIDEVIEISMRDLDLARASAQLWRSIAAEIDRLVEHAEAATRSARGNICFVIAGAAPSPVFTYLGIQSKRLTGKVLLVNRNSGTGAWDRIGPFGGTAELAGSRDVFTLNEPRVLRDPSGTMELFVACSNGYKYSPELLDPMTSGRGRPLNGVYRIVARLEKGAQPLDAGDLPCLTRLANAAIASRPTADFVLAFGGPMWAAYWLGRECTATVSGYVELPNFVPGAGYVPALASPMSSQPWIPGLPRVLVLAADPHDDSRTRAGAQATAIEKGLTAVLKPEARARLRVVPSARADELIDLLEEQNPNILHIHSHGGQGGSLGLENGRGDTHVITPERFLAALRSTDVRPALTVIVACHSAGLIEGLRQLSDCVVVVHETVGYDHSATFAEAFYRALTRGKSVAKAFEQGVQQAGLVLDPKRQPFELATRKGVDADRVVFWPEPRSRKT